MVYLPSECIYQELADIKKWAQEAEATGEVVLYKGRVDPNEHIDLAIGLPVDYMHGVLEGVTKLL